MHSQVTEQPTSSQSTTNQQSQERSFANNLETHSPQRQGESTSVDHQQQSLEQETKNSILRRILKTTFTTAMNAAVTIFGVGVGVGMILGDTYTVRRTSNVNTMSISGEPIQDNNESQNGSQSHEQRVYDLSVPGENQGSVLPAQ